jgi:arabinan endo-1,5-alpha-L-arabinosidase
MPDFMDSPSRRSDSSGDGGVNARASAYVNPVLDWDFPDPAIIHAPDGFYYAYATQSLRDGEWINIQVARSTDLIEWDYLGDALPEKPDWARTTQDFWAPSVIFDGSTYFMY